MDAETAEVIGHDVTTITCVCGNTVSKDGLIQANSQGVPVHLGGENPGPRNWRNGLRMRTSTPCAPHAAACTATPSSKRQGPHPLLSVWTSSPVPLPRQSGSTGTSVADASDSRSKRKRCADEAGVPPSAAHLD